MSNNESDSDTGYHTPPEVAEFAGVEIKRKVRDDVQQIYGVAR